MSTEILSGELAAHFPKWVGSYVRRSAPAAEKQRVALLQLDIAGFSAATDRLSGRRAEELNHLIGECFGLLSDVIEAHGGDILAFAGDAILALWNTGDALESTVRAAQCGLALRDVMLAWGREHGDIGHRTAIETGDVHFCRMGGHDERWHHVVVGDPFARMGGAYRAAAVGDVCLCAAAAQLLAGRYDGEATTYGARLLQMRSHLPPRRNEAPDPLPRSFERLLPKVVRERAEAGRGTWMGEFRALTIVRVIARSFAFDGEFQEQLHALIRETQVITETLEGVLHQVLMDDKGLNLNVIFGLPHVAHEDDPVRAVEAAIAISRRMGVLGVQVSIGVATGGLFCGTYGSKSRQEFGVFGQAINLAALLADTGHGEVVCDAATAQAVGSRITFTVVPHIYGKGGAAALMAFSPQGRAHKGDDRHAVVGRENERARLRDGLDDAIRGQGHLVVVSGEPGMGKSRLLTDLGATATARGVSVLQGIATAINRTTAYFVWRDVLRQLLGEGTEAHPERVRARLQEAFAGHATHLAWLPLLETVVRVGLAETPLTLQITGAARAAAIEDLVVALLAPAAPDRIVVLEDLQWFDGSSLDLLAAVARRLPRLLVVVSNRTGPVPGSAADRHSRLVPTIDIRLQPLSREAIEQIVRQRLQVAEVPRELAAFVHRHAGGNPFYSDELVLALRDTGRIRVVRGICTIEDLGQGAPGLALTDSLERAIVSRIDVLSEEDQIVLKVASAIGDEFTLAMLEAVLPDRATAPVLHASVRRLVDNEFLVAREAADGERFDFRHSLTREASYSLLSLAQRRLLHRAIATFIEAGNPDHLQPFYARLARHWDHAGEPVHSLHYLELAARQALLNYSNREAIRYVDEMSGMAQRAGIAIADDRRAAWEIISGDAHHELSEYELSSGHYAHAMRLLRQQVPASGMAKLRALLANCAMQMARRLGVSVRGSAGEAERSALQHASHIYEHLSEQYFFLNDSLAVLNGTLASLNLAERCGATPETIRGFGALSLGLGMSGLVGPARKYSRRAHLLAEEHGSLPELARVQLVSGVLEYGLGEWDVVRLRSERAIALYRQLGDRTRVYTSQVMGAFAALLSGDSDHAERLHDALVADLSEESSAQVRAWRLSIRLLLDLVRGEPQADDVARLHALAGARLIRTDRLLCLGVVARCCERMGDAQRSAQVATEGLHVLRECSSVWGGYAYGAAGVVEVLVSRWEGAGGVRVDASARTAAEAAIRELARLARTSPVCRPFAALAAGRAAVATHRMAAARRKFARALAAAEGLRMPGEQAEARQRLAATHATLPAAHPGARIA